ncbi:MAG: protein phosphatase 2C domain-containing protein [Polyangiaceae bacterium]|nr:protein phosphatase 2C domain-containing protein [Polyangiaceae bacterium]
MTMPWPRLATGQQTDPGRDPAKQENEDALAYQQLAVGHLLLVCDGMGGHSGGREASHLAITTVVSELAKAGAGVDPGEALVAAIQEANRRVYAMGGPASEHHPGSTCVAVLVHPMGTEVAHLGDSRAYLLRGGVLWPLTQDHSMVREMVEAGLLRPEEAVGHPESNKITRALGIAPEAQVELRSERLLQQAGDLFVLVTDGVSDVVRDTDLQALGTVAAPTGQLGQLCEQVVQLANARGGPDNITILAASVVDPGLRPEAAQQQPRRAAAKHTVIETVEAPLPELPAAGVGVRPGAGATVKLAVHPGEEPQRETLTDLPATPEVPRGTRQRVVGAVLLVVGLLVMLISWRLLQGEDEEPPPLPLATPSASGSG